MAQTIITITHEKELAIDLKNIYLTISDSPKNQLVRLENLIAALAVGQRMGAMTVLIGDGAQAQAVGSFIVSGPMTAGDTILINGVTLTVVASGATNNQINVGASAALQCAAIVSAINSSSSALVSGCVQASGAAGVCTLTAVQAGQTGNAITISKGVDAGAVDTVSGPRLTGGADISSKSATTYKYGV